MAKTAALKVIPPGHKIVTAADGKSYLQKVKRSHRRYKMPLAQRKKIAAAAKRIKIPIVTVAVNAPEIIGTVSSIQPMIANKDPAYLLNQVVTPLTGVSYGKGSRDWTVAQKNFDWKAPVMFWGKNILTQLVLKTSPAKSLKQKVGRMKLPISLS